ncbi:hypothetical protein C8J57DRAFT_1246894 [Mycena rebaudengoi]|nr:hypothetical protein C8J57DRAFT_1246894 [Mycena rebaudengoi]
MTGFLSNWQSFLGRMRHVLLTITLAGLATFNREQLLMELLVVMGKFGSTLRFELEPNRTEPKVQSQVTGLIRDPAWSCSRTKLNTTFRPPPRTESVETRHCGLDQSITGLYLSRRLDRTGLGGLDVTPADIVRGPSMLPPPRVRRGAYPSRLPLVCTRRPRMAEVGRRTAPGNHRLRHHLAAAAAALKFSPHIAATKPQPVEPALHRYGSSYLMDAVNSLQQGDLAQANPRAERDGYISAPVEQVKDVVHWWGSSTPAERAFSSSSLTGTKLRNRLTPEIFEALQLLKSAYRNGHISATADAGKHMDALIAELDSQNFGFADLEIDSDGDEFIIKVRFSVRTLVNPEPNPIEPEPKVQSLLAAEHSDEAPDDGELSGSGDDYED